MSDQVQCPNCGGYHVEIKKMRIDQKMKKRFPKTFIPLAIWSMVGLCAISFINLFDPGNEEFAWMIGNLIGAALFLGISFWTYYYWNRRGIPDGFDHRCFICNYKWSWKEGEPLPQVNVRPELIRLGERKR